MFKQIFLAGAATLAASAVLAQTYPPASQGQMNPPSTTQSTPSTTSPASPSGQTGDAGTFVRAQKSSEWRAARLIGTAVTGPDDAKIGDVNDVLLDKEGKVQSVVLGVGGFLGAGEKEVAVPYSELNITSSPAGDKIDKIAVRYTKDELKNAPTFEWAKAAPTPAAPPASPMMPPPKNR
ncbi:MAG: PRC-barrel domain containing protein [Xanthobacteraceae bacterium]|nr:MAG: PRC-barrel domain containing protein [Xanthobacteraceae bacterium]